MERLDSLRVAHDGVAGKIAQATVRVKLGDSLGVLHEYDHLLSVSHPEDSSLPSLTCRANAIFHPGEHFDF